MKKNILKPNIDTSKIVDDFFLFTETGDDNNITSYSIETLKKAQIILQKDHSHPYYQAMVKRIEELESIQNKKDIRIDKWKERFIGAAFTIVTGTLLLLIKCWITGKW